MKNHLGSKVGFALLCGFLFFCACAGRKTSEPPLAAPPSLNSLLLKSLWSKKMRGAISGLSISATGNALVVATSPDPDIENSAKHYLLSRWDSAGRLVWEFPVQFPVRDQDLSEDGALLVVSNYENQILGFNSQGKVLWKVEGTCRPHILHSQRILCYHDDDAEPGIAFDIFDGSGKKLQSFPISGDVLGLKISEDEAHLALALTGGHLLLLQMDSQGMWQKSWQKRVDGEVIDLAVSSGNATQVAALFRDADKKQKIGILNADGNPLGEVVPSFLVTQLEMEASGNFLFYTGTSALGQYVGSAEARSSKESWRRGVAMGSEYSASIALSKGPASSNSGNSVWAWFGFEERVPEGRQSRLIALDQGGQERARLELYSDEESDLYLHKVASRSSLIVVSTDDARISLFSYDSK